MSVDQLAYYQKKLSYEIDSWDLYEALSQGEPFMVVDGRTVEAFAVGHIPGAINLPHRGICVDSTAHLEKSKVMCATAMALAVMLLLKLRLSS